MGMGSRGEANAAAEVVVTVEESALAAAPPSASTPSAAASAHASSNHYPYASPSSPLSGQSDRNLHPTKPFRSHRPSLSADTASGLVPPLGLHSSSPSRPRDNATSLTPARPCNVDPSNSLHSSQGHRPQGPDSPERSHLTSQHSRIGHRSTRSLQLPTQFSSSINSIIQSVTPGRSAAMGYTGDHRPKTVSVGGGSGLWGGLFTKNTTNGACSQQPQAPSAEVTLGNLGFGPTAGSDLLLSPTSIACSQATHDDSSSISSNMGFGQKLRNLTGLNSSASSMKDGIMSSAASIDAPSFQSCFSTATSRPTTPIRNSISSAPSVFLSPSQHSTTPRKSIAPTIPENTELVNEFQGLDFTAIISSFLTPPLSKTTNDSGPGKASPQSRLEGLADTASNLLERMYSAYRKRTEALAEVLAEQEVLKEELECSRDKVRQFNAQMERMLEEQKKEKEEQDEVMLDLVREKVKIEEERLSREEWKEDWKEQERVRLREEIILELSSGESVILEAVDLDTALRKKRVSSGGSSTGTSDSGFDSDCDSLFSLGQGSIRTADGSHGSLQPPLTKNGKIDGEKQQYSVRMVAPLTKCDSCSKALNSSFHSSSVQNLSTLTQVNPLRLPTPLTPLRRVEAASASPTASQKEGTPAQSRWGFGAFRGNNTNNSGEVDKLRAENKVLRARVGDLESSVSEVLGILGGWREVNS